MLRLLPLILLFWTLPAWAAPLQVVASLPSLAALTRDVGGPLVQVEALTSPRQDPHYADAKPNLIVALNRADVLVVNGLELEVGWLPPLIQQARNGKIQKGAAGFVDASTAVRLLGVHTGPVDRAMGDVHPGGNPHFLLDPRAGAKVAVLLGNALAKADPGHAAQYQQNAQALAQKLEMLARTEAARFAQLPAAHRQVVAYHDSLVYVMDWLGLKQVATLEPRPGIAPSPQQVATVLQQMKAAGVTAIAQEDYYPSTTAKTVAGLAHAKVALLPGGVRFPQETYADHIHALATALLTAL
jgi:zinc/manganese transport system substrate-binding protein